MVADAFACTVFVPSHSGPFRTGWDNVGVVVELKSGQVQAVLVPGEAAAAMGVCVDTLLRAVARNEVAGALRIGRCIRFVARELLGAGPEIILQPVCTVAQLADALRVHADTIRGAVHAGQVEGVRRVGTALRFDTARVLRSLSCQASGSRQGAKRWA